MIEYDNNTITINLIINIIYFYFLIKKIYDKNY